MRLSSNPGVGDSRVEVGLGSLRKPITKQLVIFCRGFEGRELNFLLLGARYYTEILTPPISLQSQGKANFLLYVTTVPNH